MKKNDKIHTDTLMATTQNFLYGDKYDFIRVENPAPTVIVLLFVHRSGSTLLACLMAQTGVLGFPLEYFASVNTLVLQQRLSRFSIDNLAPLLSVRSSPNGVFSYKWNRSYEKDPVTRVITKKMYPDYCIFIDRKDRNAQALSFVKAQKTQQWVAPKRESFVGKSELSIQSQDIDDATRILADTRKETEILLGNYGVPAIRVMYEDIVEHPKKNINEIANFCGQKNTKEISIKRVSIAKQNV